MARILWTAEAAAAAGRINKSTFQTTRAGKVCENTNWLVNHRTEAQQKARQRFRYITSYWRSLSDADRGTWNAKAPDGQDGFHFFCSVNMPADRYDQPVFPSYPPSQYTIEITSISLLITYNPSPAQANFNLTFTTNPAINGLDYSAFIKIEVCTTGTCTPNLSHATFVTPYTPSFFTSPYHASWSDSSVHNQPTIIEGAKCNVWLQIVDITTSEPVSAQVLTSALVP